MGTPQATKELQSQIKALISELGWSQNQLARVLYTELSDWDDEDEILKFQEKLKKELQRSTTKVERLTTYLEIITDHPDTQKLDVVFNKYIPSGAISKNLSQALGELSKEIDRSYLHKADQKKNPL